MSPGHGRVRRSLGTGGLGEEIWKQGGGFLEVNKMQYHRIGYPV